MRLTTSGLVVAAALCGTVGISSQALADPGGTHLYVGANYGGYKDRGGDFDEDDDFKEALIGLQFNEFLGIEAAYMDFGDFGGDVGKAEVDGYSFAVVGRLPLTESFSLFAKGGQLFWDSDVSVAGVKESYDGDEFFYGVGADFSITEHLVVALEYDRYKVDLDDSSLPEPASSFEEDMDTVKLGARLKF